MRQCPQCGYKDNSFWRNVPHSLYRQYVHISELETFDPTLTAVLRATKNVTRDGYIYHLTKAGYVSRIHVSDSVDGVSWEEADRERPKRFRHMGQKLLVVEDSI
jgi:hypothetical protein